MRRDASGHVLESDKENVKMLIKDMRLYLCDYGLFEMLKEIYTKRKEVENVRNPENAININDVKDSDLSKAGLSKKDLV